MLLLIHKNFYEILFLFHTILRVSKRLTAAYTSNRFPEKFKMILRKTRSANSRQDCHFDNFEVLHNAEKNILKVLFALNRHKLVIQAVNQRSKFKRNEQQQSWQGHHAITEARRPPRETARTIALRPQAYADSPWAGGHRSATFHTPLQL